MQVQAFPLYNPVVKFAYCVDVVTLREREQFASLFVDLAFAALSPQPRYTPKGEPENLFG